MAMSGQLSATTRIVKLPPKTITHSAHGLYQARIGGVLLQLLAQPAYMHIDSACITDIIVAPHVMQQLVACQNGAAIAHEVGKQLELLGLQLQDLPPAIDAPPRQVDAQGTGYQFTVGTWHFANGVLY